ncbi:MAG: 2-haloacid dehalogenase, partial [Gammaproteobacteria bacterium]
GLRVAWTNRARQPKLQIGIDPTYTTKNLQELADILANE